MCGFVGYLGEVPRARELLGRMTSAIAHRGPDEDGIFISTNAGLGHVRLSIVGLEDGQQPMSGQNGHVTIAFNGEIFNYIELREELKAKGHQFFTNSDTEVILNLYAEMGMDCVEKLNGDFAFAIHDAQQNRIFLARDRMGVRPLFYTWHRGVFYFASEIKALLEVDGIQAELDPIALDQIFTLWSPIAPRTVFKNIHELEPASRMVVRPDSHRVSSYWELDYPDAHDASAFNSDEDAATALRELLADATRIRMRADVPVGSYLSGGLDSSIACALAAPMASKGLQTFSVAFDNAEYDESSFQKQMAQALGTCHHTVMCGPGDTAAVFPDVIRFTERPVLRTAPAPLFQLSALVRQNGMKVVLTGEGADEVFAGYDLFKEAKVRRFCSRSPQSRMRPHLFRKLYPYMPGLQKQSAEYLARFFDVTGAKQTDPLFSHRPRFKSTASAKLFFSADLKEQLKGYDAADELCGRLPARFSFWHPLHQAQYLESRYLLPGYILSSQGDRMAMAHGVEGRFPFLDHRIVEFASQLSPEQKLKGLTEKNILREATRDIVPEAIINRPKQPYRAPDSSAFSGAGCLDYVRDAMSPDKLSNSGLFNPVTTRKLFDKCQSQTVAGFRDNSAFVGILSTQLWLDTFK